MKLSKAVSDVMAQLKPKLQEYMILKNIWPARGATSFSCPNKAGHENGDKRPSAGIYQDGGILAWHCHGCGAGKDIFSMAHFVEGLPESGPEFITQTVKTLADELGVHFDPMKDMPPEEKERVDILRANGLVKKYLSSHQNQDFLKQRNIDPTIAQQLGIGTADAQELHLYLLENGISADTQMKAFLFPGTSTTSNIEYTGKNARMVFNKSSLVFPVTDARNNVIAFISRNMCWSKDSQSLKYINTPNNAVFKKSDALYLLCEAKPTIEETGVAFIVEGTVDAVTMFSAGIRNVVAVMGTNITEEHIDQLKSLGATRIIFCLDGDKAGRAKTISTAEKLMETTNGCVLQVKEIPEEMDPDEYIKENGVAKFRELPVKDLAEHMIHTFVGIQGKTQTEAINDYLRWMVSVIKAPLDRIKYAKILARITGTEDNDMISQLEYHLRIKEVNAESEAERIFQYGIKNWTKVTFEDKLTVLDDMRRDITNIVWSTRKGMIEGSKTEITGMEKTMIEQPPAFIKTGFHRLDKHVIIPKRSSRVIFGAYPNIGKSNITRNLAMGILENNPDVAVLYCTLDDATCITVPSFLGMIEKYPINNMRFLHSLNPGERTVAEQHIRSGFRKMREWMDDKRFLLVDQTAIPTISALESYVIQFIEGIRDRDWTLVVIVDSVHSFMDMRKVSDPRFATINTISEIKRIANVYGCTFIMNGEMNKTGRTGQKPSRPTLANLSETGRIEYLVNIGATIHSDLFYRKKNATRVWRKPGEQDALPVLELDVEKNKEAYFKGSIWYKLDPYLGIIYEMSEAEQRAYYEEERASNIDVSKTSVPND